MSTAISPLAGKPAPTSLLVDVPALVAAYADLRPDPAEAKLSRQQIRIPELAGVMRSASSLSVTA